MSKVRHTREGKIDPFTILTTVRLVSNNNNSLINAMALRSDALLRRPCSTVVDLCAEHDLLLIAIIFLTRPGYSASKLL